MIRRAIDKVTGQPRFYTEEELAAESREELDAISPIMLDFIAEEARLNSLLNNQTVLDKINSGDLGEGSMGPEMVTILEGIIDRQKLAAVDKASFKNSLALLKEYKPGVSSEEVEELTKEFQIEAIKAYQRIASSTVSMIEGEISALTSSVPGAFSFDYDPNEDFVNESKPFQRTRITQYQVQIRDVIAALDFMLRECGYVREYLSKQADDLIEVIDENTTFQATGEVTRLITITKEYIDVISDTSDLQNALDMFNSASSRLVSVRSDTQSRQWGTDLLHGMISFATFACRVAESESDLNKLNQVDGAGVVRRGLTRAFGDIIVLDQKFYPDNNQIPLPPTSIPSVVINQYLLAYRERAQDLVTASYDQVNSINNKFDRQIANTQRNLNSLSETMLMPKRAAISAAGPIVEAIPTPAAYYSQTTGRPLSSIPADLERRKQEYRDLATKYMIMFRDKAPADARRLKKKAEAELAVIAAVPGMVDLEAEIQARLEASIPEPVQHTAPPPPPPPPPPVPRSPSEAALRTLGIGSITTNPRKRRKRKK